MLGLMLYLNSFIDRYIFASIPKLRFLCDYGCDVRAGLSGRLVTLGSVLGVWNDRAFSGGQIVKAQQRKVEDLLREEGVARCT